MDPSHACFLHDGVAGKWEDAAPLSMHLKDNKVDTNQVHQAPYANDAIRMLYLLSVPMYMKLVIVTFQQPSIHDAAGCRYAASSDEGPLPPMLL